MAKKPSRRPAISEDPLAHRAFPELAKGLHSQIERIIEEWMVLARRALPSAATLSHEELRDNLPNILARMVDALGSAAPDQVDELKEESPAQGLTRFKQRYEMRELMTEDRLLRKVIIMRSEAGLKRGMSVEEQVGLNIGVDLMLQEAVVAFVNQQNAQLRTAAEAELKYLSFLSHDLNNNLGTVTLWLQVLKSQLSARSGFGDTVAALDTAQQAILDTIGGMGRLLQAERLRRQGIKPAAAPVNLKTLASNVALPASQQADRKGVKIVIDIDPDAVVVSDGELMTLVLQNLIGNAVKYSMNGTIRVRLDSDDGDGRCVLSVSDEGPGIAPEQLQNIFAAFGRGHTYGQTGIGLGLTIASQAAKLLGGELRVESDKGAGSTFSLILPSAATDGDGDGSL